MTRLAKTLAAALVATGTLTAAASAQGADPTLQYGFSQVKQAYLVGVERNTGHTEGAHANWCSYQSYATCRGEMFRYLDLMSQNAKIHRIGADGTCRVAAKLKAAREGLRSRVSGGEGGHYGWCMGNQGRADAFVAEEIGFMRMYFQ